MKHIFVIHSNLAFLASISIVNQLKLPVADILLFCFRKYKPLLGETPYITYDVDDLFAYGHSFLLSSKIRDKYVKSIDTFIDKLIEDEYVAYLPQLLTYGHQVLVSNQKCTEVHLFQESAKPFFKRHKSYKHYIRYLLLSLNDRVWAQEDFNIPSYMNKRLRQITAWSFDNNYFAKMKYVQKKPLKMPNIELPFEYNSSFPFFVFEAAIEGGHIEKDVYMDVCDLLVQKYGETCNYLKFHPGQTKENREEILMKFSKCGKKYIIIPDGIPFELIILKYENLKVVGFTSSLIYFAQNEGHNVISKADYLKKRSKKFRRFINSIE